MGTRKKNVKSLMTSQMLLRDSSEINGEQTSASEEISAMIGPETTPQIALTHLCFYFTLGILGEASETKLIIQ